MSKPTRSGNGDDSEPDNHESDSHEPDDFELEGDPSRPVPAPVHDEVTVELVRDAVGVARGELSDEQFFEKYGDDSTESAEATELTDSN